MELTETQRRICENLIKSAMTKYQLYEHLYERFGKAHQQVGAVHSHLSYLKRDLKKLGIQLKKRASSTPTNALREYYFDRDDIEKLSEIA